MMKKLLTIILTVILLSLCFGASSLANDNYYSITFSEDLQTMNYKGNDYSRIDASMLITEEIEYQSVPVSLTKSQSEKIKNVSIESGLQWDIVYATINYKDGSTLSVTFMKNNVLAVYDSILDWTWDSYIVDLEWPEGNTVNANKDQLLGKKVTLGSDDLNRCDFYYVFAENSSGTVKVQKGAVLNYDDDYYYVDFDEAGVYVSAYEFMPYSYSSLTAREITDEKLIVKLDEAVEKYYSDEFGFFFDDAFTEKLSAIFIIAVFAVLPLAIFVIFLILAIRKKKFYRKLYITICALSATELTVFAAIAAVILSFN